MMGQCVCKNGQRYNVIILAGGAGSRMGTASDYVPKALATLGESRVIDHIITRHLPVAGKFIIGTAWHADLLEAYTRGRYGGVPLEFSREIPDQLRNNAFSTLLCLDHTDSRMPTLLTFCDLLAGGITCLEGDTLFTATKATQGRVGTFRHTVVRKGSRFAGIEKHKNPVSLSATVEGLVGYFDFSDTIVLKSIAYTKASKLQDFTEDVVLAYARQRKVTIRECPFLYEFGTENDIAAVRELWKAT